MGWNRNEVEFVLDLEKILPKEGGRSREQVWEKYYSQKLKSTIRRKERLIFDCSASNGIGVFLNL